MISRILLIVGLTLVVVACQRSTGEVQRLADERIATALAGIPTATIQPSQTPQPTATPQPSATPPLMPTPISQEGIEDAIDILRERLEAVEFELVAQDNEFRQFITVLNDFEAEVSAFMASPPSEAIVIQAVNSQSSSGLCWLHRTTAGGNGNTFHVQWELLGRVDGLCYSPLSICAREVRIGGPLPESCGG